MCDEQTTGLRADKTKEVQVYLLQLFTKLKEVIIKHLQTTESEAKGTWTLEGVKNPFNRIATAILCFRAEIGLKLQIH